MLLISFQFYCDCFRCAKIESKQCERWENLIMIESEMRLRWWSRNIILIIVLQLCVNRNLWKSLAIQFFFNSRFLLTANWTMIDITKMSVRSIDHQLQLCVTCFAMCKNLKMWNLIEKTNVVYRIVSDFCIIWWMTAKNCACKSLYIIQMNFDLSLLNRRFRVFNETIKISIFINARMMNTNLRLFANFSNRNWYDRIQKYTMISHWINVEFIVSKNYLDEQCRFDNFRFFQSMQRLKYISFFVSVTITFVRFNERWTSLIDHAKCFVSSRSIIIASISMISNLSIDDICSVHFEHSHSHYSSMKKTLLCTW